MRSRNDTDRIVRRILRVNHAGEHGAVEIYGSQLRVLGSRKPEITNWLFETRNHEIEHRKRFKDAMGKRGAKPCRAMFVWRLGGYLLGAGTALLGERGVLVCTAAVEKTVHRHLIDQISFLDQSDPELAILNRSILIEEDQHLNFALAKLSKTSLVASSLMAIVAAATELLILVSTRGDSLNLPSGKQAR